MTVLVLVKFLRITVVHVNIKFMKINSKFHYQYFCQIYAQMVPECSRCLTDISAVQFFYSSVQFLLLDFFSKSICKFALHDDLQSSGT